MAARCAKRLWNAFTRGRSNSKHVSVNQIFCVKHAVVMIFRVMYNDSRVVSLYMYTERDRWYIYNIKLSHSKAYLLQMHYMCVCMIA